MSYQNYPQQQSPHPFRLLIVGIIAVFGAIFLGLGVYIGRYYFFSSSDELINAVTGATPHTSTSAPLAPTAPAATAPNASESAKSEVNQAVNLPADAFPVNDSALRNAPPGKLQNLYKSGATSDAFATNVHVAYLARYSTAPDTPHTVEAFSPVTGQTYTMDCQKHGQLVHCQGGNDAHVYIQ
ncbi:hypothetical protein [Corynebacterium sp.]|uniref:hypothetical protein n=1 Tax=Corynebacterium sp. TaxID=1720 RepID=UPI0026DCC7A5|nr:hypothetical protein [Corynebacterium sp.]MDO5076216.1 hypothetical protein [Corynebacterium sp.]